LTIELDPLESAVADVYHSFSETEEKDVEFFLGIWRQCVDEQQRRDLIKSFRRQLICVAAGEALTRS
jgi:hypothetical protein